MERESFMLATASHPRFKFDWIPADDEALASKVRKAFENVLEKNRNSSNQQPAPTNNEEDDLALPSRVSQVLNELDLFLVDKDKSLTCLNKYPAIKEVFLRFDTGIPSSAPVERLFSAGSLILTVRRNRLSDDTFETLLLLKVYKGI